MRYLIIFTIAAGLLLNSCIDKKEFQSNNNTYLDITILNQSSEFSSILSRTNSEITDIENMIYNVSIFVYKNDSLVYNIEKIFVDHNLISLPIPINEGSYSAFVIANLEIEAPKCKKDLLSTMCDVNLDQKRILRYGMPMASKEYQFNLINNIHNKIAVELVRCHSSLYIQTVGEGLNNNYTVTVTGAQLLNGALIPGDYTLLAKPETNSKEVNGYSLSNTSLPEPVLYYYPTDGEIEIKVQSKNENIKPIVLTIDKTQAKIRNLKYTLSVFPSMADNTQ